MRSPPGAWARQHTSRLRDVGSGGIPAADAGMERSGRFAVPATTQGAEQGCQRDLSLRLDLHQHHPAGEVIALRVQIAQVVVRAAAVASLRQPKRFSAGLDERSLRSFFAA